jgi:hypothetical protein
VLGKGKTSSFVDADLIGEQDAMCDGSEIRLELYRRMWRIFVDSGQDRSSCLRREGAVRTGQLQLNDG